MKIQKLLIIRISLLAVSLALVAIGIFRGEVTAVLNKSCRICLECIGIG